MSGLCTDDCDVLADIHTRECWRANYDAMRDLQNRCAVFDRRLSEGELTRQDRHHDVFCLVLREQLRFAMKYDQTLDADAENFVRVAKGYADLAYAPEVSG